MPTPTITSVEYRNTEYGFSFALPESWRGYTIATGTWDGLTTGEQGETVSEQGLQLSIRHPQWTEAEPRQDIPIIIFTLAQWVRCSRINSISARRRSVRVNLAATRRTYSRFRRGTISRFRLDLKKWNRFCRGNRFKRISKSKKLLPKLACPATAVVEGFR